MIKNEVYSQKIPSQKPKSSPSKGTGHTVRKQVNLHKSNESTVDDIIVQAYKSYMKDASVQSSMFDPLAKKGPLSRKPSRVSNKTLPYGFRTKDAFKDLHEKLSQKQAHAQSTYDVEKSRSQTLYTQRINKEYYTGTNPKGEQILDTLFRPVLQERSANKQEQRDLTDRLMQHKDKIREKKLIRKIDNDIKIDHTMIPVQQLDSFKKSATTPEVSSRATGDYYKMYDHQMKLETQRKVKMYDMAVKEYMDQQKTLTQARPCRGSERILGSKSRQGSIHDRLYENGVRRKSVEPRERVKNYEEPVYSFNPKINNTAKKMVRTGKIEDRLMNDAKKRIHKKETRTSEMVKTLKKGSQYKKLGKSSDMILKKFTKEYQSSLFEMNKDKEESFGFQELCEIMQRLGFMPEKEYDDRSENPAYDVWIILGGETQDEIIETSIYNIMVILQNLDYPFLYSEKYMTPSRRNVM